MAKNNKLNQIKSNIAALSDLVNRMTDAEIYPVSFFSQAFDMLQQIQSDFHALESEQVAIFDKQMKKHRELILSVHRQVRGMEPDQMPDAPEVEPESTPNVPDTLSVKTKEDAPPRKPVAPETPAPSAPQESVHKKMSLLGRLGFYKEDNAVPAKKTAPPDNVPDWPAPQTPEPTIPPLPPEPPTQPEPPAPPLKPEKEKTPIASAPVENSAPPSVNDMIEKRKLSDLRKAFSLNDRFLYRRELFGGSETAMNKVIASLNEMTTLRESIQFLEERLHWDFSNPTVKDFVKILEMRFL